MNPLDKFVASSPASILDTVREEAARCCDETARFMRGERGRLLNPVDDGVRAEFSDSAFGVAGEVAMVVARAMASAGVQLDAATPWSTAAVMLRNGWQRGHKLVPQVLRKGAAS